MRHREQILMNWTDERVEALRKYWSEGLSASQIAAQLGGVSRNAVIGKVHRLKLSGRGRTPSAPARQKKVAAPAASAPAKQQSARPLQINRPSVTSVGATALASDAQVLVPAMPQRVQQVESVTLPISRMLSLIQLNERTCKWPIGDPLQPDFHFCGNDAGENGPYCRYHARIAFQPAAERRRK
jgi:GcrA cell cycle regulator